MTGARPGRHGLMRNAKERGAEAALDTAAWEKCGRCKIRLLTGDIKKTLTGKKKFHGAFDALFLGAHFVHLLQPEHSLLDVAKPGAPLVVETGDNLLFLGKEPVAEFRRKIGEFAAASGWQAAEAAGDALPKEDLLLTKPVPTAMAVSMATIETRVSSTSFNNSASPNRMWAGASSPGGSNCGEFSLAA
eukprot:jgi/Tetstr1/429190/TSEL_019143.t1